MLLHASVESGICARNWGSRLQKARTATNVCFHLPSQATLRTLPDKSPSQSATQLGEQITEAVMFMKNVLQRNVKHCYAFDGRCLLWSHRIVSTGKCPPVFKDIGFFSRGFQCDLLFQRLTWIGPSRPFCSRNIGWWDFSLEQVGNFRKYQVTFCPLRERK